ncbi:MAG: outer membrane lipoprotein LolB [Chromatiales bacterium]|nr:MAG: outer membrane lipoprotein LolB [Chromatiales bacterium]
MRRLDRRRSFLPLALLGAGLLAGCVTRGTIVESGLSPAVRRATLESLANWEARGRIALKTPGTSGQGSFAWIQTGDQAVLRVSGPFGAGAYEIRWDPARLTVLSKRGEVAADYTGPDAAERFLDEQLGWSLPVANTRHWLLGLVGPDSPAVPIVDASGLLVSLTQDGWQVRYGEYRTQGGIAMPRKLVFESAAGRIRFVVDAWQF